MGFTLSGILLVLWAAVNTAYDVSLYGWETGNYWWFCNLALCGMGIALITRSRGLLIGFLAIASYTQSFWMVDNLYFQLTSEKLFGLTSFMYRPGYPLIKFILSHYHYFTLPLAVFALLFLPKGKTHVKWWIVVCNPFIFGVSYFAFSSGYNVNCIHRACFPGLDWSGPLYSFGFWAVIFVMHLGMGVALEKFFNTVHLTAPSKKAVNYGFAAMLLLCCGLSLHDTQVKLAQPQFTCASSQSESGIEVGCRSTRITTSGGFLVQFFAKNHSLTDQVCSVWMDKAGEKTSMNDAIQVSALERIEQTVLLPYPKENWDVKLQAKCQSLPTELAAK